MIRQHRIPLSGVRPRSGLGDTASPNATIPTRTLTADARSLRDSGATRNLGLRPTRRVHPRTTIGCSMHEDYVIVTPTAAPSSILDSPHAAQIEQRNSQVTHRTPKPRCARPGDPYVRCARRQVRKELQSTTNVKAGRRTINSYRLDIRGSRPGPDPTSGRGWYGRSRHGRRGPENSLSIWRQI